MIKSEISEANDIDFKLLGSEGCKSVWLQLRASERGRMIRRIEYEAFSSYLMSEYHLLFNDSEKEKLHGQIDWRICVGVVEEAMSRNPVDVLCAFYEALIDTKDSGGATQHARIAERMKSLALDQRRKNDQGLPHGTMESEQHDGIPDMPSLQTPKNNSHRDRASGTTPVEGVQSGKSPFHSPLASSFQCLTVLAIVCAAVVSGFAVYGCLPWAQILIETQDNWKGMLWTTGLSCISEEDVLLREALKQAKSILCSRLPIELLPPVLEGKGVISADERQFISREPSSSGKKLMLLEQMESKSISGIRQFLDILKSDKSLQGYGYLADMVESDCAMLVREKKEPTTGMEESLLKSRLARNPPREEEWSLPPSHTVPLEAMPCALQVFSSVVHDNKVYMTGIGIAKDKGARDDVPKDDVSRQIQVYPLDGEGSWSTLPEDPRQKPAPNYNAPVTVINGHIALVDGRDAETGKITNVLSTWDEEKHEWENDNPPSMPTKRLASGVCHRDNLLLVVGGVVDDKVRMLVKVTKERTLTAVAAGRWWGT